LTQNFTTAGKTGMTSMPLICFSHLRWNFVIQRPQHLMQQFASRHDVTFWEEPLFEGDREPTLKLIRCGRTGVTVAMPILPAGRDSEYVEGALQALLDEYVAAETRPWIRWYYTPMMLPFSRHLKSACTVYDCMDELSNFKFAPPDLQRREAELLRTADVVFTGGYSLYEAKRHRHANIHPFPSSIDQMHFAKAIGGEDPADQRELPRPRLGFYGVIDERMDLELLASLADARPHWQLVMVGPIVKISEADLPRRPNIHYLGQKDYGELPDYLSGWDVALMPFAINESTRFISPTKTPEYLAAGRPVVSTPIKDVERHYGMMRGVKIAASAEAFVTACEEALALRPWGYWHAEVKDRLAAQSWRTTALLMEEHMARSINKGDGAVVPMKRRKLATTRYDYLVVGAGFAGAVLAERLAAELDKRVLLIDRRSHVGGNAYDYVNEAGVLMHQYGPHIFHTNSEDIFQYLSQFTSWRPYEHRVLANVDGQNVPIPINRTTLNALYGLDLKTDEDAAAYLAARAEPTDAITTSEDVVVAAVGRELYEKFFRGYTRKQWGLDPSELDKSVTARVPTRTNTDDRYFTDRFQYMPRDGYTAMFKRMLDHPNIDIMLSADFEDVRKRVRYDRLVYTGPIDAYFHQIYGKLPYRSLRFQHETLDQAEFQSVGTVNYPDERVPYTRITEYKHLTGQKCPATTVTYEFPCADGDPFYPIPKPENQALYKKYEALALKEEDVVFAGRLATYRYYNMDQVVGQALATFRRIKSKEDQIERSVVTTLPASKLTGPSRTAEQATSS
jgi:UDP-galactopyranose mutase